MVSQSCTTAKMEEEEEEEAEEEEEEKKRTLNTLGIKKQSCNVL